jgi:hypothetical protein
MTAPVELDLRARRKEQTDSLTTAVALPGTREPPSGSVRFIETDHDDLQDLYGALETASSPRFWFSEGDGRLGLSEQHGFPDVDCKEASLSFY